MSDNEDPRERAHLDELLSSWHEWQMRFKPVRTWKGSALVCGNYRSGRWNDDDNGELDAELERLNVEAVDFAVSKLEPLASAAIHQEARNLAAGLQVFVSPRLPADRDERRRVINRARLQVAKLLMRAGVM